MRTLMWLAVGFTAACVLGAYLLPWQATLVAGLCLLLVAIGGLLLFREPSAKRIIAVVCLGLGLGMVWYQVYSAIFLKQAVQADGKTLSVVAIASDYSYPTEYGTAVDARVTLNGKRYGAKLYLDDPLELAPGDEIRGAFRLRFTGPQGEKASEYHSGTGVFLLCYEQGGVKTTEKQDRSLVTFAPRLRKQILEITQKAFPADTAAFAKAILLGDTTDLTYEQKSDLTVSGIIHVVSVSGLHVSILFALLFHLLGARRFLTPLVGTFLLLFVAAVSGFSPSIVRSCLMNELVLLSLLLDREPDLPTGLGFAVVTMLIVNPVCIMSVGFQLSVMSVVGILAFSEPIADWIRGLPIWGDVRRRSKTAYVQAWVAGSVSVSVAATVATAPLTAIHFGSVSLISVLTNMLTIGVVNVVFSGVILTVIVGTFWLPGARLFAWILSWGIRYVLGVAGLLSFPLASVYVESIYVQYWLLFAYAMIAVIVISGKKAAWQLCTGIAVTLIFALGLSWLEPRMDRCRVTVLDVGQGQCILLQSGNKAYMIDCGGDYQTDTADKAVALLYSQGVFQLDGLILTHYDEDHVGAAPYLLSRMKVETLYLPLGPGADEWEWILREKTDAQIVRVDRTLDLECNGGNLQIFDSDSLETSNESSLCVLFQKENYDILITGDRTSAGELELLASGMIPKLDVLVAGHHGASSSTSELLLRHTEPEMVLISVGKDNSYGHPAKDLLARLERYGCIVRRTDLEGTIIIRR